MTIKVSKPSINLREKLNELNSSEADKAIKDGVLTVKSAKVYGEVESDTLNVKGNVTFTDDTGLTDKVIWDSGTEELTIGGNVGIGTTGPYSRLDVVGGDYGSTNGLVHIKQNVATNAPTLFIEQVGQGGNTNDNQGLLIKVDGTNNGNGNIIRAIGTNSNVGADVEAFTVKNSGKVGIGTTSPNAPLHIADGTATVIIQDENRQCPS